MDRKIRSLSESGTVDCGQTVLWQTESEPIDDSHNACIVTAAERKKPFRLRLNLKGDGPALAYIGLSNGQLITLQYNFTSRFGIQKFKNFTIYKGKYYLKFENGRKTITTKETETKIWSETR